MNFYIFNQKQYVDSYKHKQIKYHHPVDMKSVISQRNFNPKVKLSKFQKVRKQSSEPYYLKTVIKTEPDLIKDEKEIVLLNPYQDQHLQQLQQYHQEAKFKFSSTFQPKEMHNIKSQNFNNLDIHHFPKNNDNNECQNLVSICSKNSDDSGIESDCTDGNLSWLLNYKLPEIPPVPVLNKPNTLPVKAKNVNIPDSGTMEISGCKTTTDTNPNAGNITERLLVNVEKVVPEKPQPTVIKAKDLASQKPPFTYTELIEYALTENGALTVSEIYNWISQHFPFYHVEEDRWKNSVRHNLSINPQFRKGEKAVQGAGHFWTLAQINEIKIDEMRQRINTFLQITQPDVDHEEVQNKSVDDTELQVATESILEEIQDQYITSNSNSLLSTNNDPVEIELVNISPGEIDLEDFLLPPVSKNDLVNECGLGNDFFITDINPEELGQNFTEVEVTDTDSIYDEMSFEYYGLK